MLARGSRHAPDDTNAEEPIVMLPKETDSHPRRRLPPALYIMAALAALTVVVYLRACTGGLQWADDEWYVIGNEPVHQGLTFRSIHWALTMPGPPYWHPLTWLSFQLDYAIYGLDPTGYHLTNILLHTANTVLFFWVLCYTTGALWRCALAAALFALHPLHVESVAWITERKDVLCMFFWLLTMLAYAAYARRPGVLRYLLVVLLLILGLMSKPMMVTLPCALLLFDYWPLQRWHNGLRSAWPLLREKLPLFALCAAGGAITIYSRHLAAPEYPVELQPFDVRLATALCNYMIYLRQTIWPTGLALCYPDQSYDFTEWQAIGAGIVLVSLTALLLAQARRRPYLLVGWLWFLGTLLPVMGILAQVRWQSRADRFTYIPLMGLNILAAWGFAQLVQSRRIGRLGVGVTTAAVLSALAFVTWVQIGYWHDSITTYRRTLAVTSDHYMAHGYLAIVLERDGQLTEARRQFERFVELNPDPVAGHNGYADFLYRHNMVDEAARHYELTLASDPAHVLARNNLGVVLTKQGKLNEAVRHLQEAVRRDPAFADAYANLGSAFAELGNITEAINQLRTCVRLEPDRMVAHFRLGTLLAAQNRLDEALTHLRTAASLGLASAGLYFQLGEVHRRLGAAAEAITAYRRAAELQPGSALYEAYLAYASYGAGHTAVAHQHYQQSLRLDPGWLVAANKVAWDLATHPQPSVRSPSTAMELAEQICQATHFHNPEFLSTLAVAYADRGRFEDAVRTAKQALALAEAAGASVLVDEISERLELFEMQRPYHAN
jgi:tetratricopeptide (TPR) repeat protein